jgi:hypothetical protein
MNKKTQEIKLSIKTALNNLNNYVSSHIGKTNNLTKCFSTDASVI